jgi:hypothetical protein
MIMAGLLGTHVAAQAGQDPFGSIVAKLDQILAAVGASKIDLRGVTQNWDKALPANDATDACNSSRFTCVFGGVAVRDNETGLVWERTPTSDTYPWVQIQDQVTTAREYCAFSMVGGHMGWRLPSLQELTSLADPTLSDNAGTLTLPPGHPFSNAKGVNYAYWTSTTMAENPNMAYLMSFAKIGGWVPFNAKDVKMGAWCVRGGAMGDRY